MALTGALLLDRERELARLGQLVDATADGGFGFVVIEGPAGAGKSALLDVLAAVAAEAGVRVLRATGLELEREYPFGVVRQLFEPALHALDPPDRDEVFSGVAALAGELLTGRDPSSGPKLADAGFALAHSFYWSVVGLSDLGPLALVVDDIQWADVPSLRFLAFLLKRSEGLPLLLALAQRLVPGGEESDPLKAVLAGPASVIQPAPLSVGAIGVLLARAAGRELEVDAVLEAERLTGGNPLYVRELADSLSRRGGEVIEDPRELVRAAAPAAIGRRVQTALARTDSDVQAIAKAAAILGDEVPLQRAAALAEVESEPASAAADRLAGAGILMIGEPLRFRHPLVRQAVLDSIEPRARARSHARAARLLIAEGEPPERAAVHLLDSDPVGDGDVVRTLRASAKSAIAEGAPGLAIRALRRALREPPAPAERPLVLGELAIAETRVGDPDFLGHFEEAFAASACPLEQMADSADAYAQYLAAAGRFAEAEALIDRILDATGERERKLMLEAVLGTLAVNYEIPAARERLARTAVGVRGETAAERLLLGLWATDAVNSAAMSAADAASLVSAALDDGSLLAELGPDSPTYLHLVRSLSEWDELDLLEKELDIAAVQARRSGPLFGLAIISTLRAVNALKRGQLFSAEAEARTATEIATQMGWAAGFPVPLSVLVTVLTDVGELDEAERMLEENNLCGYVPENQGGTILLGTRGRLRLQQGRTEEGIEDLSKQLTRLNRVRNSPPHLRADLAKSLVPALLRAGRAEEARQISDDALRIAQAFGRPRYIAHCLRALALAAPTGPDLNALQAAAPIYERLGASLDLARTLVDIGEALRRQRQAGSAREPLRQALDLARACGARLLAERAEHELRAAGARPRRDRITGRDALTATELRVAQFAIEGMTNRQIGETLFVTKKTVESHLDHIFHKLGIHARGELQQALSATGELR